MPANRRQVSYRCPLTVPGKANQLVITRRLGTEAFVQTLWDPDVTHKPQPAPRNKSQDVFPWQVAQSIESNQVRRSVAGSAGVPCFRFLMIFASFHGRLHCSHRTADFPASFNVSGKRAHDKRTKTMDNFFCHGIFNWLNTQ
jgi:hypothetical protein